ncbi:MAG TPA: urease accessory UreF family protein [Acidimicrobiales bacterium]|nr:urease accessory UreF family protein [Acidimicrobiales bacterium]
MADGRFPAGGYVHSGGLEQAVVSGRVCSVDELSIFLVGRLKTLGRTEAALSALSWSAAPCLDALFTIQAEAVARSPSPAWREASCMQGRNLVRAAQSIWPLLLLKVTWPSGRKEGLEPGPMYPVALGAVGNCVGLGLDEVALVAAQGAVSGPAWAATRLLGLDPFAIARCLVELAPAVEEVAAFAAGLARDASDLGEVAAGLPAHSAPLLEIGAEGHCLQEVRLFAS